MLQELRVRDLGVIEETRLALGPGMTALTGETGAGKTLLVGALALLLGGRGDPTVVRPGADEALVEGRFVVAGDPDDPEHPGGADGAGSAAREVVLARTVAAQGRSRAWLDARAAPVAGLAEVGAALVELHGQHAHRALVEAAAQRAALDSFAGTDLGPLRAARRALRRAEEALAAAGGDRAARARQQDLLRHEIAEIDDAAVEDEHEEERLAVEEERLADLAVHRQAAAAAATALAGADIAGDGLAVVGGGAMRGGPAVDSAAALDAVGVARQLLGGRAAFDGLSGRLAAVQAELADVAADLRHVVERWEDDPAALAAARERRQRLRDLVRRYGGDLGAVLAHAEECRRALAELLAEEAAAAAAAADVERCRAAVVAAAAAVAVTRRRAAPPLAAAVEARLGDLGMGRARLQVAVEGDGPADQVTMLLAANPGEPPLPLAKVASGGELARTMLALRLVLSEAPPTMVFDEVDAGIGGEAALAVGRALAELARHQQVLVVTHLAQVAAFADRQLSVRKREVDGRTRSEVHPVDGPEREAELARMLSGQPDSVTARRHAAELLAVARAATA